MKIYLVPPSVDIIVDLADKFGIKPDVLLSYAFRGSFFSHFLRAHRHKIGRLLLDSGAYSHMIGTAHVDLDSYIAFLGSCAHLFDYCINLDTDPENYDIRNWNLARIRGQGFNPLPVIHDPYAGEIDQLYDQGSQYILIGSSFGNDRKQLDFIFNRYFYGGRFPGIRFHKLGTTNYATLAEYPFYSSDSAAFARIGGFGIVLFWNDHREPDPNGDRTNKVYFGDRKGPQDERVMDFRRYPYLGSLEDYLWRTFEYRLEDMTSSKGAEKRYFVNARYTLDLEERMTRLHGD